MIYIILGFYLEGLHMALIIEIIVAVCFLIDFESKLKTLGFEIESKTESGHVATLDLKEQRETDRLKREAEKNQKKSPKKQPTVKVTEEIVTSFKFSDDKVTTQSKITEPRTPVTVRSTTAVTPGGSLYSLIRKQTPGGTPASLPDLSTRARPAGQKFHDSFSSDETSFEDEPEPQSNKPTSITITTNIRRPASTSSDYRLLQYYPHVLITGEFR